jgi:hypothetical protein
VNRRFSIAQQADGILRIEGFQAVHSLILATFADLPYVQISHVSLDGAVLA